MFRMLLAATLGLCLAVAGMANELLVVARATQPVGAPSMQVTDNGTESDAPVAEECYIALIPIYHINASALALALGGSVFSFNPLEQGNPYTPGAGQGYQPGSYNPYGYGGLPAGAGQVPATQTGARGGAGTAGVNPSAPLAAFVPDGIESIVGIN